MKLLTTLGAAAIAIALAAPAFAGSNLVSSASMYMSNSAQSGPRGAALATGALASTSIATPVSDYTQVIGVNTAQTVGPGHASSFGSGGGSAFTTLSFPQH